MMNYCKFNILLKEYLRHTLNFEGTPGAIIQAKVKRFQ